MIWWRPFARRQRERELDAELQDHLERMIADFRAGGADEPEARRRALVEFGGVEPIKETCRDSATHEMDRRDAAGRSVPRSVDVGTAPDSRPSLC